MHANPVAAALANLSCASITWLRDTPHQILTLRRAWPRGADHMLAEFNTPDGGIIAGQWFADAARGRVVLDDLKRKFPTARLGSACIDDGLLTLQGDGADDKMPALATWLMLPDAALLVHRPTRRAVLRATYKQHTAYVKIVPSKSFGAMLDAALRVTHLASQNLSVPTLLHHEHSPGGGAVVWSPLSGTSVHDLLRTDSYHAAMCATGLALAALHRTHMELPVPHFSVQNSLDELRRWADRTSAFDAELSRQVLASMDKPARALAESPESQRALIHRDFHDKQVFVTVDGHPGMLDFDTLSLGDPALDLGNMLAHLDLRREQGRLTHDAAATAQHEFLGAYAPTEEERTRARSYQSLTLLRLACVYAFRTGGRDTSRAMLHAAEQHQC